MPLRQPIASIRIFTAGAIVALICSVSGFADDKIDFAKDIKSVLSSRCYQCHGAKKQEAGLRLDAKQAALDGGDSGAVIVPGRSDESELFLRISTADADKLMPPEGARLTEKQVELIRQWIEQGAAWPDNDGGKPENARRFHDFRVALDDRFASAGNDYGFGFGFGFGFCFRFVTNGNR